MIGPRLKTSDHVPGILSVDRVPTEPPTSYTNATKSSYRQFTPTLLQSLGVACLSAAIDCMIPPVSCCLHAYASSRPLRTVQLWSGNHISRVNERAKLKRLWARMLRAHTSPRRFSKPWPSVLSVLSSMHAHGGSGSGRSLSPLRRADLPSSNSNLDGRRRFHRQVRGARLKQYIGWRGEVEMEGSWDQTTTSHSYHDSNKHKQHANRLKSLIHCSFWVNPVSSSGLLHLVR